MLISKKKQFLSFLLLAIIFGIIDQIAKEIVRQMLVPGREIVLITDFLSITLIENSGISFGLLSNLDSFYKLIFLNVIPLFFVIGITIYSYVQWNNIHRIERTSFMLIIGGASGNLYDRFLFGSVTDFTQFKFFGETLFINNLADDFISIGIGCLVFANFKYSSKH